MKKFFLALTVAVCSLGICSAQDLEKTTEMFNNAATLLNSGNKSEAANAFEQALNAAEALGEEGKDIADQCKSILPDILISLGKELVNDKNIDEAVKSFSKAADLAGKFGNTEVAEEAKALIPQVMLSNVGSLLNEKNFEGAIEACKKLIAIDPANGTAYLRMGMAQAAAGKINDATASYLTAIENGEKEAASKQLSTLYLKKAAACQKAKDLKGALENAQKSVEFLDNATAQKVIGISASGLKQYKTAVEGFEAYLALSPNAKDKAQIIYQLGDALIKAGDNAKACGYFKQIAQDAKWGEAARYQITTLKCN
ncbi:MAG: hypothetical protein KBT00_05235 [Bacteroidales bacterium]|nr:hypothetical protein [Candidatus Cacconaster merdequi]